MGDNKLDPKIKQITNEFEKEIRFTENTIEFHLKEDASLVTLAEDTGADVESNLTITIISQDGSILLESDKVTLQSEDGITLVGQAGGIIMKEDSIHWKAPLVNQKK